LQRVGELIGRVHETSVSSAVRHETFQPSYAEELWRTLASARDGFPGNVAEAHLQRFVVREWDAIEQDWAGFIEIGHRCRQAHLNLAITHGDWPFNMLRGDDDSLYLVDWDELLLAPVERDLWFPHRDAAFDRGYREVRPDYTRNELATAYYVNSRFFEDLFWSSRAILTGTVPAQHSPLAVVETSWMDSLRARMKKLQPS